MQIYMKSEHGGYMPVYNSEQINWLTQNGWQLVPEGEWPNPAIKIKEEKKEEKKNKTSPAQLAATKRYYDKKRAEKLK